MFSVPRAGVPWAPSYCRHKSHRLVGVCLFTKLVVLRRGIWPAGCEIRFWEVPCTACLATCTPKKGKSTHLPGGLCTLKMGRE